MGNDLRINGGSVTFVNDETPEQECEFTVKLKGKGTVSIPGIGGGSTKIPDLSYEEQEAGFRDWDGDKVYVKSINFGTLTNKTEKRVPHHIQNLKRFIRVEALIAGPNGTFTGCSTLTPISTQVTESDCYWTTGHDFSAYSAIYMLYYTCTDR